MSEATYLVHHGVKGMKWGVRRTPAQLGYDTTFRGSTSYAKYGNQMLSANGENLYGRKGKEHRRAIRAANRAGAAYNREMGRNARQRDELSVRGNAYTETYNREMQKSSQKKPMSTAKKVAIGAAVVGGVALAAYGGKKYHDYIRDTNAKYHAARGEALVRVYKQKVDVRDWRRNNEIFEAVQTRTPTGYTARKALAVQDADERVYAKTANKIRGYEKRKADSDTFRQARKNAKEYKRMRNNPDASGSVSAQVFRKELSRHTTNRYGKTNQHPHNRRRYLNDRV